MAREVQAEPVASEEQPARAVLVEPEPVPEGSVEPAVAEPLAAIERAVAAVPEEPEPTLRASAARIAEAGACFPANSRRLSRPVRLHQPP